MQSLLCWQCKRRSPAMIMEKVRRTPNGASANCWLMVWPVAISAPAAATKPIIAARPFMSSGPEARKLAPSGVLKAKASAREYLRVESRQQPQLHWQQHAGSGGREVSVASFLSGFVFGGGSPWPGQTSRSNKAVSPTISLGPALAATVKEQVDERSWSMAQVDERVSRWCRFRPRDNVSERVLTV